MNEVQNVAAVFDFDGVLFDGHFWIAVARHYFKNRIKLIQFSSYFLTHMPLWLAAKLKIISDETNKMKWAEDLAVAFKGFNREQGSKIFNRLRDEYVAKCLRPDMLALVQEHRKQGHTIIVLSGCFADFLETLKPNLGADYIIGTQLEVKNDAYTGKIVRPLCFGVNKARFLNEFLVQVRPDINLNLSYAYADSLTDAPVLESVGRAIAAYPDKQLGDLARLRGWVILP
jgi:HAD superfamily hydrolase (TIGR01490 family)